MPARSFNVDVVQEGLDAFIAGPDAAATHPMHDPAIWFAEASSWVFDDSGLFAVLEGRSANELLGTRLLSALLELRTEIDAVTGSEMAPAPTSVQQHGLAARAHAVRAELDGLPPGTGRPRGAALD
jgi:hypothetical protein